MKRLTVFLLAATALLTIACNGKVGGRQAQTPQDTVAADTTDTATATHAEQDSMLYGFCGEGMAMNTVELVTHNGKSRSFTLNNSGNVLGGLEAGDSIAILSQGRSGGMPTANVVVNISSLMGRWVSLNHSFTLYRGGRATTKLKEGAPLVTWELCNGKLIIAGDTFAIRTLGPDSLYLKHGKTTTGYRRMTSKK